MATKPKRGESDARTPTLFDLPALRAIPVGNISQPLYLDDVRGHEAAENVTAVKRERKPTPPKQMDDVGLPAFADFDWVRVYTKN